MREAQAKLVKLESLDRGDHQVHQVNQEELVALECRANRVMMGDLGLQGWLDNQANRVQWDSVALQELRVSQDETAHQENVEAEETRGLVVTEGNRVRRVPQAERGVKVKEVKLACKEPWG